MEKKTYFRPEIELLDLIQADVLGVSFSASWMGTDRKDYGFSWFNS
jgi:hypothetical protein